MKKNKRLKFGGKKRILICVLLILAIIVEFIAYKAGITKAQEVINVDVSISDYDSKLDEEHIEMEAKYNGEEYYIVLPNLINNKTVIKYYAEVAVDNPIGIFCEENNNFYAVAGKSDAQRFTEEIINIDSENEDLEDNQNTEENDLDTNVENNDRR